MLHEVTEDGGVGFCYEALPAVLPAGYYRPLVIALDSNIVLSGVQTFECGQCLTSRCPYAPSSMLAPDLGKWASLLSLFGEH